MYAGAFIALRGIAETLREEIDQSRSRGLVWTGTRETFLGRVTHQVDWNPALDHLRQAVNGVDSGISAALDLAASAHAAPSVAQEQSLEAALARAGETLRLLGVYLSGIRAAQYALHDAPPFVIGGLGFNDGVIERVEVVRYHLEALRSGADPAKLKPAIDRAIDEACSYVEAYFQGLRDGAKLLEAARVVGVASATVGLGRALAATARLLAGAVVESGGLSYALAGAAGGSTGAAAASSVSIQGVLKGLAVAGLAGTLTYQMGGVDPVNAGKDGERRAGVTGPRERIPSLTGTAKYRVPDRITEVTLEEVKNAIKVPRTKQLEDFLLYSQKTKRQFVLWIRRDTRVASSLTKYVDSGRIRIEYIP